MKPKSSRKLAASIVLVSFLSSEIVFPYSAFGETASSTKKPELPSHSSNQAQRNQTFKEDQMDHLNQLHDTYRNQAQEQNERNRLQTGEEKLAEDSPVEEETSEDTQTRAFGDDPFDAARAAFDTNGDGTISVEELVNGWTGYLVAFYKSHNGLPLEEYVKYDLNGDGLVTLGEGVIISRVLFLELPEHMKAFMTLLGIEPTPSGESGMVMTLTEAVEGLKRLEAALGSERGQSNYDPDYDANNDGKVDRHDYEVMAVVLEAVGHMAREYDNEGRLTRTTFPDGSYETYVYDNEGNADKNEVTEDTGVNGRQTSYHFVSVRRIGSNEALNDNEVLISIAENGDLIVGVIAVKVVMSWKFLFDLDPTAHPLFRYPLEITIQSYEQFNSADPYPNRILYKDMIGTNSGITLLDGSGATTFRLNEPSVHFGDNRYEITFLKYENGRDNPVGRGFYMNMSRPSPFADGVPFLDFSPGVSLQWSDSPDEAQMQIRLEYLRSNFEEGTELFFELFDPLTGALLFRGKVIKQSHYDTVSGLSGARLTPANMAWRIVDALNQPVPIAGSEAHAEGRVIPDHYLISKFARFAKDHPDHPDAASFREYLRSTIQPAVIRNEDGTIYYEESGSDYENRAQIIMRIWDDLGVAVIDRTQIASLDLPLLEQFLQFLTDFPREIVSSLNEIYLYDRSAESGAQGSSASAGDGWITLHYLPSDGVIQNFAQGVIRGFWVSVMSHELGHIAHNSGQIADFDSVFKYLHDLSESGDFVTDYASRNRDEDFGEIAKFLAQTPQELFEIGTQRFKDGYPLYLEKLLFALPYLFIEERDGKSVFLQYEVVYTPIAGSSIYRQKDILLKAINPAKLDSQGRVTEMVIGDLRYHFVYNPETGRLTDVVTEPYVNILDLFDLDQDGQLSPAEVIKALSGLGPTLDKKRGEEGFNEIYDFDGSGTVNEDDVTSLSSELNATPESQAIVSAFNLLDTDANFQITFEEISDALQNLEQFDPYVWDMNQDGAINYPDRKLFVGYLSGILTDEPLPIQLGDVSGDGKLSSADVTLIRRHLTAVRTGEHPEWRLDPKQQYLADLDGDNEVREWDGLVIRKLIVGTLTLEDLPVRHGDLVLTNEEIRGLMFQIIVDHPVNFIDAQTPEGQRRLSYYDLNNDGFVDGTDMAIVRDITLVSDEVFQVAFLKLMKAVREKADERFDLNGDGSVDLSEYMQFRNAFTEGRLTDVVEDSTVYRNGFGDGEIVIERREVNGELKYFLSVRTATEEGEERLVLAYQENGTPVTEYEILPDFTTGGDGNSVETLQVITADGRELQWVHHILEPEEDYYLLMAEYPSDLYGMVETHRKYRLMHWPGTYGFVVGEIDVYSSGVLVQQTKRYFDEEGATVAEEVYRYSADGSVFYYLYGNKPGEPANPAMQSGYLVRVFNSTGQIIYERLLSAGSFGHAIFAYENRNSLLTEVHFKTKSGADIIIRIADFFLIEFDAEGRPIKRVFEDGSYETYSYDDEGNASKNFIQPDGERKGTQTSYQYTGMRIIQDTAQLGANEVIIAVTIDGDLIVGILEQKLVLQWEFTQDLTRPLKITVAEYEYFGAGLTPDFIFIAVGDSNGGLQNSFGLRITDSYGAPTVAVLEDHHVAYGDIRFGFKMGYSQDASMTGRYFFMDLFRRSPFPPGTDFLSSPPRFTMQYEEDPEDGPLFRFSPTPLILNRPDITGLFLELYDSVTNELIFRGALQGTPEIPRIRYLVEGLYQFKFPPGMVLWKIVNEQGEVVPSLHSPEGSQGVLEYTVDIAQRFARLAKDNPGTRVAEDFDRYLRYTIRQAVIRDENGILHFEETQDQYSERVQKIMDLWRDKGVALIDGDQLVSLDPAFLDQLSVFVTTFPQAIVQHFDLLYLRKAVSSSYLSGRAGQGWITLGYRMLERVIQNVLNGSLRATWTSVISHELGHVVHNEPGILPDFDTFFKALHEASSDPGDFTTGYAMTNRFEEFGELFHKIANQTLDTFDHGIERFDEAKPLYLEKLLYALAMFIDRQDGQTVLRAYKSVRTPIPDKLFEAKDIISDGVYPAELNGDGRISMVEVGGVRYVFEYDLTTGRLAGVIQQDMPADVLGQDKTLALTGNGTLSENNIDKIMFGLEKRRSILADTEGREEEDVLSGTFVPGTFVVQSAPIEEHAQASDDLTDDTKFWKSSGNLGPAGYGHDAPGMLNTLKVNKLESQLAQ